MAVRRTGDVSAADGLWISGYPLLAVALIRMTRLRAPGRLREGLLDGLAMATVVAALFVQFMILPTVSDGLTLTALAGVFYPFGDVLLFAAATILVLSPGDRSGPNRYLVAAFMLTFIGDVSISVVPNVFPEFDGGRLDGVLLLANSLFAAALWHPAADRLTRSHTAGDDRLHPARVVFLGVTLVALPALADLGASGDVINRATLLTAMIALTVIVLIRFTLVVRDQSGYASPSPIAPPTISSPGWSTGRSCTAACPASCGRGRPAQPDRWFTSWTSTASN